MSQQINSVPSFGERIADAIEHNFLIVGLITSQTQAKRQTLNLPFGVGKTSLAFWLSYGLNGYNWDTVFERAAYNPVAVDRMLQPGTNRRNIAIWDDVQMTAPAEKTVPKPIIQLAGKITTSRPQLALLLMTAPNINSISAPLRRLVTFEIIVAERGSYEIQQYRYTKNFEDPKNDYCKLYYIEEGSFPALPADIQDRYDVWREKEKKKISRSTSHNIEAYCPLYEEQPEGTKIEMKATVRRSGSLYVVSVPRDYGEKLYNSKREVSLIVPSQ